MVKSRLRLRRRLTLATVDVKDVDGNTVAGLSGLEASHQQTTAEESSGPFEEVSTRVIDLFFFEPASGSLPAILETHTISWSGTDYEVRNVISLNELVKRLRVETERVR